MVAILFSVEIKSLFIDIEFNYKILNYNIWQKTQGKTRREDPQSITPLQKCELF